MGAAWGGEGLPPGACSEPRQQASVLLEGSTLLIPFQQQLSTPHCSRRGALTTTDATSPPSAHTPTPLSLVRVMARAVIVFRSCPGDSSKQPELNTVPYGQQLGGGRDLAFPCVASCGCKPGAPLHSSAACPPTLRRCPPQRVE